MESNINYVYFGSARISASLLQKLIDINLVPQAIITIKSKKSGRGLLVKENPTSILAKKYDIKLVEVISFKDIQSIESVKRFTTNVALLLAFGKIIPQTVLNLYSLGIVNIHPSLLPKYRGPSPLQTALLNGDSETGVSLIKLDSEVDHGDIISATKFSISPTDTYLDLEEKAVQSGLQLIQDNFSNYVNNQIILQPQDHRLATFTKIITKDDGKVNWSLPAQSIYNQAQAFTPWPGLWDMYRGKRLKLISLSPTTHASIGPGKVGLIGGLVHIGCQNYTVALNTLQLEGKKIISAIDFINGNKDFINYQFK